jgi:hypothetical protein
MSQSVSEQHPAVVLRSHYNHVRALLVAATVAVVVLAITVAILAVDSNDGGSSAPRAQQAQPPTATGQPNVSKLGPLPPPDASTGR